MTSADAITCPLGAFYDLSGLGQTKTYELINDGTLESISVGKRRLIVLASWRQYVETHRSKPAETHPGHRPPLPRKSASAASPIAQREGATAALTEVPAAPSRGRRRA